ncbi:phage baseplate plug family protein [Acinetobacter stercoris]|uniref:Cyanophage baseplate Pam3 plug gp18 domain-containing protein n=1 Tax=Acinetobacter stercoris TaxID=2126983 RepID=A0A2U3N1T9_9GAMM|nr:hypothetical protein [Acinetobacter stercoris]SPL71519.1 hypothetical protein KPC_2697 [Acinetobacter stercoris]
MIVTIPLDAYPNQTVSSIIAGQRWTFTLQTRLDHLYATVENENQGTLVLNRICVDGAFITPNLVFIDTQGNSDPIYSGLNEVGRYKLVWTDEA